MYVCMYVRTYVYLYKGTESMALFWSDDLKTDMHAYTNHKSKTQTRMHTPIIHSNTWSMPSLRNRRPSSYTLSKPPCGPRESAPCTETCGMYPCVCIYAVSQSSYTLWKLLWRPNSSQRQVQRHVTCTEARDMYRGTWHVQRHVTCTEARDMYRGTWHVQRHVTCTEARDMHRGTWHVQRHVTCTEARDMYRGTWHIYEWSNKSGKDGQVRSLCFMARILRLVKRWQLQLAK